MVQTGKHTLQKGRFAPSPTGPLHFGSLVAAIGSYLHAKSSDALWLIRIEDIDPPREVQGSKSQILEALDAYQLVSDEPIILQSERLNSYQKIIDDLIERNQAYYCQCNRKRLKDIGGLYDGYCRDMHVTAEGNTVRFANNSQQQSFEDLIHGRVNVAIDFASQDYVLKRRDGLYSYNLAVVVDDIEQGITQVVRGADLLDCSVIQNALYQTLDHPSPDYLHLPLVTDEQGNKLSKHFHSPAVPFEGSETVTLEVFKVLGLPVKSELMDLNQKELLQWGVSHWRLADINTNTSVIKA